MAASSPADDRPESAAVNPSTYRDADAFQRDRSLLQRHWQYAGDRRDLPAHLDSLALEVSGLPVLLVNDGGTIRGFINSCRHRGSELRPPGIGHGPLVCPYHAWSYRADGVLAGVPRAEAFPARPACNRGSTALHPVGVLEVGDLLFVQARPAADLDRTARTREWAMTQAVVAGTRIADTTYEVAADWKVVLENALEGYHIPLVHRETFAPVSLPGGHDRYAALGPHSEGAGGTDAATQARWERLLRLLPDRPLADPHYRHRLVFPNTCLWTFFGCILGITTATPTGPGTSRVTVRMYQTPIPPTAPPAAGQLLAAMAGMMVPFIARVQAEDNAICEAQQRGLAGAQDLGVLGSDERRVAAFREAYVAVH
jgi:phenylpropionate dioxygenase-like ring-hydroxylating dioxygenase large terminal subunit